MAEVFSTKSLMYWWAALSATVFLKDWLQNLANFVETTTMFLPDSIPFNVIPGLNSWIDRAADYIRSGIQFKPEQELLAIGPLHVQSWVIAVIFGLILVGLGAGLYARSLRTSTWFDDLLTLLGIYVLLRIEGHIVAMTNLPIQNQFRDFVNNPTTALVILLVLLMILIVFGEGLHSKRTFWRALLESLVVAVFMFPHETALAIGYGIQALAQFGIGLAQFTPFAIVWGIAGMFLALQRLAGHEHFEIKRGP